MDVAFITRRLMGEWCADALIIIITFTSNVKLDGKGPKYVCIFISF